MQLMSSFPFVKSDEGFEHALQGGRMSDKKA